jgi:hypothetical protein
MTTDAVPHSAEATLEATLADTPTFDFRSMRSFQIRANATVVVTVYNARRDETSRFKNVSIGGSDMTLSLTDKWLVLTQDQALALFSCHFVRLVAASGTPTIEFTAKA